MKFKDMLPGTFFIYEGWIMLKIKQHKDFNAVILKPSGKSKVDVSNMVGVLTKIFDDYEEITIINRCGLIISGE